MTTETRLSASSKLLRSVSPGTLPEAIKSLTDPEAEALLYDWTFWARPEQLPPGTPGSASSRRDWRCWFLLAGRGFGKTRVGAETVRRWVSMGYRRIHLIGPTASDVRDVMVTGESGLMSCFPPHQRPLYEPSKALITFHTGAVAKCYSAEEPGRLRGPQCEAMWCDEIAVWQYPETWALAELGMRLGSDPRAVITSTPKPLQIVRSLVSDPHTVVTPGQTYDNRANLAPAFFDAIIKKYEGTRLGRQELLGELLEDMPGALWRRATIDSSRITAGEIRWDMIIRIVIGIDPAVSAGEESDETGIIVAALVRSHHVIVLDDLSCRESPLGWAQIVRNAYLARGANLIVAERNNGGELVTRNLHALDENIPVRTVWAKQNKYTRAEPVALLYEQGRVHHAGSFPVLEDQMCTFVPGARDRGAPSPDRMDALVYAITELLIEREEIEATVLRGLEEISPV